MRPRWCDPSRRRRWWHRCGAAYGAPSGAADRPSRRLSCAGGSDALYVRRFWSAPLLLACLSGLTELLADDFAFVANAFALVRLGRAQSANFGCDLADALLIDAVNVHFVGAFDRDRDALRRIEHDGMRVAERQVQLLARLSGTITDALNLEALAESLADAFDHVRDERARET